MRKAPIALASKTSQALRAVARCLTIHQSSTSIKPPVSPAPPLCTRAPLYTHTRLDLCNPTNIR